MEGPQTPFHHLLRVLLSLRLVPLHLLLGVSRKYLLEKHVLHYRSLRSGVAFLVQLVTATVMSPDFPRVRAP